MYFHVVNMSFYLLFLSLITINGLKVIDVTHAAQHCEAGNGSLIHNLIMDNSASQREAKVGRRRTPLPAGHCANVAFHPERVLYLDLDSPLRGAQRAQGVLPDLSPGERGLGLYCLCLHSPSYVQWKF